MKFAQLLDAVKLEVGLEPDDLRSVESCTIKFDADVEVTLEPADDGDLVHLHAVLGHVGAADPALYAALLELHVFGAATGGAYFGLDGTSGRLLLFKPIRLASATTAGALVEIAAFVDQAARWRDSLPEFQAHSASRPSDAHSQEAPTCHPAIKFGSA